MVTDFFKVSNLFLYERKLDNFLLLQKSESPIQIYFLDVDGCKKVASENNWQANFTISINEILENTDVCAVAEFNQRLAHWTQISFGGAYVAEIDKKIRVDSKSAYLHGIYTEKDFRKMGIASAVMEKVSAYLLERGISRLYILVDSRNPSMLRVVAKAGFKRIGAIKLTKIGKLKLYRRKGKISDFLESK